MGSKLITLDQVAELLQGSVPEVEKLVESGELTAFPFGGGLRTTQAAVDEMIDRFMKKAASVVPAPMEPEVKPNFDSSSPAPLPAIEQIRAAEWKQVAPIKYTSRNGQKIDWKETAFACTFDVGGKLAPIVIAVFGPQGGQQKGVYYPNWRAEVYYGEVGHGMQAVNEWVKTSAYDSTQEIASTIKNGRVYVKPGEPLAEEYSHLTVVDYRKVVQRSHTKDAQCVVAHESDRASMALHALIRCRNKNWI